MIDDDIRLGEQKRKDLLKSYKNVLAKYGKAARFMSRSALYAEAANSPAPRFYMSDYRSGIVINEELRKEREAANDGKGQCSGDNDGERQASEGVI